MERNSLNRILDATLQCCGLSHDEWREIKHLTRRNAVSVKRVISFIASKEGYPSNVIASFLHLDRTSVIYHVKVMEEQVAIYSDTKLLVEKVKEKLESYSGYQRHVVTHGYISRSRNGLLTISGSCPENIQGYWIAEGTRPFHPQDKLHHMETVYLHPLQYLLKSPGT